MKEISNLAFTLSQYSGKSLQFFSNALEKGIRFSKK